MHFLLTMIDNKYIINNINTKNKINRKDVFFMCEEKKKAFEAIEKLNEEAIKGVNLYLSMVLEHERNRADTTEERMREIREAMARKEAEEKLRKKRERKEKKVSEMLFEKLRNETLHQDNMQDETMDFLCLNIGTIRTFLSWHPGKLLDVIEVVHTHGVKAGAKEKSHQPNDQVRKAAF